MTDEEMAEEWLDERYLKDMGVRNPCKQAFLAGLKAGRPKWRKVADSNLPKDESRVWLCFGADDYGNGQYIRERFWCDDCGWLGAEEVVAWCEMSEYEED